MSFLVITITLSAAVVPSERRQANETLNRLIAVRKPSRPPEPDLEALQIPPSGPGKYCNIITVF